MNYYLYNINKRGIGSIMGTVLIILISVVAVGILFGVLSKTLNKATKDESYLCLGIDIKVSDCIIVNGTIMNPLLPPNLQINGFALLIGMERFPGGKNIENLKFAVKNSSSVSVMDPINVSIPFFSVDTDYTKFLEYSSFNAVVKDFPNPPSEVSVSAVVGESKTVCKPTREPTRCVMQ